jgi:transcriptional regulator
VYTPRHFDERDLASLDWLFERDPFVTLITTTPDGRPFASHLPVLYRRDGEQVLIEGHWARPNPQVKHAGPALLIAHGPHAYISPGWYPDKESAGRVPTWNYATAHLSGLLETSDDAGVLADLVSRLSARFEESVGSSWQFETGRDDHVSMLRGIVAFRFVPAQIEIKFKLNQNHPEANVRSAAAGLTELGQAHSSEIAALMLDRLAQRAR